MTVPSRLDTSWNLNIFCKEEVLFKQPDLWKKKKRILCKHAMNSLNSFGAIILNLEYNYYCGVFPNYLDACKN